MHEPNTARNALVGVLTVVIAVLLVAVGYLGRVVLEDDERQRRRRRRTSPRTEMRRRVASRISTSR